MLKSPIASLISLAKRKIRSRSEKKLPSLRFIIENEDKEQVIQTTDYASGSAVKEEETQQDANVSLTNILRLEDEVESFEDLDNPVIKHTAVQNMAKESKQNPIRKLETIEVSHKNL